MPRICDNIEQQLVPALRETIAVAARTAPMPGRPNHCAVKVARHYGFTDEELDFIINYDIKHRLGRDGGGEHDRRSSGGGILILDGLG